MISYTKKFIFIHIPRTGGTSIEEALNNYGAGNANTNIGKGGVWNPDEDTYKKLVSILGKEKASNAKHLTALDWKKVLGEEYKNYYKFTIIRHPVEKAASIMRFNNQNPINHPDWLIKQSLYFEDENGNNIVDDIFKFENLNEEWKIICNKLDIELTPLPHKNNSNGRGAKKQFGEELYNNIKNKLQNEIIKLGYE